MNQVMNVSLKILLIFMISVTVFCTFGNGFIYAADDFDTNYWDPSKGTKEGDSKLLTIGNKIIGPIQLIGSFEEKAQYKETLGPYFLGAVFVFGITNLLSIVYNIAISLNDI